MSKALRLYTITKDLTYNETDALIIYGIVSVEEFEEIYKENMECIFKTYNENVRKIEMTLKKNSFPNILLNEEYVRRFRNQIIPPLAMWMRDYLLIMERYGVISINELDLFWDLFVE